MPLTSITIRPTGLPPAVISKNTLGLDMTALEYQQRNTLLPDRGITNFNDFINASVIVQQERSHEVALDCRQCAHAYNLNVHHVFSG